MLDFLKDIFGFWRGVIFGNSSVVESVKTTTVANNFVPSLDKILQKPDETPVMLRDVPKTIAPAKSASLDIYNPEMVISDAVFTNCSSMTESQIQSFIESKGSFLKDYKVDEHLSSYWIYKYCNDLGLNPQVLITNIQKEQGSITKKTIPTQQTRLDYFCGVGAYSNPIRFDEKWKGVNKQIEGSVIVSMKRFNKAKSLVYPYTYKTDRPEFMILYIQNAATKSCYDYTPYSGDKGLVVDGIRYDAPFGNALFHSIFSRWFG